MDTQPSRADVALVSIAEARMALRALHARIDATGERYGEERLPQDVVVELNDEVLAAMQCHALAQAALAPVGEVIGTGIGRQRLLNEMKACHGEFDLLCLRWAPIAAGLVAQLVRERHGFVPQR